MDKTNESRLSVVTSPDGRTSSVEMLGTTKENLFNLALLFRDVCMTAGIPPVIMAAAIPGIIRDYEKAGMAGDTMVDLGAIKRAKGGGTP